jgi:hypothetical protein
MDFAVVHKTIDPSIHSVETPQVVDGELFVIVTAVAVRCGGNPLKKPPLLM